MGCLELISEFAMLSVFLFPLEKTGLVFLFPVCLMRECQILRFRFSFSIFWGLFWKFIEKCVEILVYLISKGKMCCDG